MRAPPELALQSIYEALGAFPQVINFPEVYLALASKTVDGQCNTASAIYAAKFFEVQKYIAYTKHQYTAGMLFANTRSWAKLSPELRLIVSEEAHAAATDARTKIAEGDEFYLGQLGKAGVAITRPDIAPFRDRMGPAYKKIRAQSGDAAFDEVTKLAQKALQAA